ncbi:MAG: hypothetical protein U0L33_06875 [Acutalibacteraceae bacterium]|nr:hypothetical protein [Acutalibacteraceae bacterium]
MKKFLKFVGAVAAIFSAVLGALAVFDRLTHKNRIKDGYLECEVQNTDTEE